MVVFATTQRPNTTFFFQVLFCSLFFLFVFLLLLCCGKSVIIADLMFNPRNSCRVTVIKTESHFQVIAFWATISQLQQGEKGVIWGGGGGATVWQWQRESWSSCVPYFSWSQSWTRLFVLSPTAYVQPAEPTHSLVALQQGACGCSCPCSPCYYHRAPILSRKTLPQLMHAVWHL